MGTPKKQAVPRAPVPVPKPPTGNASGNTKVGLKKPSVVFGIKDVDEMYPTFVVATDFVAFHNKLAEEHNGNFVTKVMASNIETMMAIVRSHNVGSNNVENGLPPKDGDIGGQRNGLVHSFAGSMLTHLHETVNNLQADLTNATSKSSSPGTGQADFIRWITPVLVVTGLTASKELSSQQKLAARMLPAQLQKTLGINQNDLLNNAEVLRIELLEAYIKEIYALTSKYQALRVFEYPNSSKYNSIDDPVLCLDEEPEFVSWDQQTHTVEVKS